MFKRLLYVVIGMFLGITFTSDVAVDIYQILDREADREILASTLTGMSEGWERGKYYTEQRMLHQLGMCHYQLEFYRRPVGGQHGD